MPSNSLYNQVIFMLLLRFSVWSLHVIKLPLKTWGENGKVAWPVWWREMGVLAGKGSSVNVGRGDISYLLHCPESAFILKDCTHLVTWILLVASTISLEMINFRSLTHILIQNIWNMAFLFTIPNASELHIHILYNNLILSYRIYPTK